MNPYKLSYKAFAKLSALDSQWIGTDDYQGIAYYWNYAYRHYLRDCSDNQRKRVHKAFLKAGIAIDGESDDHMRIIKLITGLN